MNERLIKEIIRDLEKISNIVNYRLEQLYEIVGDNSTISEKNVVGSNSNMKKEMDKQRAEMMSEMDKIRKQAMAQVQNTINEQNVNVPNIPIAGQPIIPSHMLRDSGEKK